MTTPDVARLERVLDELQAKLSAYSAATSLSRRLHKYRDDPVAFAADFINWPDGGGLADYQEETLAESVGANVATRAPRGAGKTMPAAVRILHFALTSDGDPSVDWKAPVTAGSWLQLRAFTWPEVHKWSRRLRWSKLGREPFHTYRELKKMELALRTGEAFGINSDDPDLIEGAHADRMLLVADEAKSIGAASWDAMEGYFSTPGHHSRLAISTPGAPAGVFYDIHTRRAGYEAWKTIHVTVDRAIRAGRLSPGWVDEKRAQWGEDSRLFKTHVLAEFAGEADGLIPLAWIDAAVDRWIDEYGSVSLLELLREVHVTHAAIDPADEGGDENVLAYRSGNKILGFEVWTRGDTMETANKVSSRVGKAPVTVDAIGVGAGVAARLGELGHRVQKHKGSEGTKRRDSSGTFGFTSKRAAAWWNMRELLDPAQGHEIMLPPDDLLKGDLAAPRWREVTGAKIEVEPKETQGTGGYWQGGLKKRLGRSTDRGDAVVMAFWESRMATGLRGGWVAGEQPSLIAEAG